ncbi:MAG: hypothetical protein O7E51_10505 [Acidobacteria bacterium]|nr:hypothetical protein [Acidobacteriota bacterium]
MGKMAVPARKSKSKTGKRASRTAVLKTSKTVDQQAVSPSPAASTTCTEALHKLAAPQEAETPEERQFHQYHRGLDSTEVELDRLESGSAEPTGKLVGLWRAHALSMPKSCVDLFREFLLDLPKKSATDLLKTLAQEVRQHRTAKKRGRKFVEEDPQRQRQMVQVAWWRLVQGKSCEEIGDQLQRQGVAFYRDETHNTKFVESEIERIVANICKDIHVHNGLLPDRSNLNQVLDLPSVRRVLMKKYEPPFSCDPQVSRNYAARLYFPGSAVPEVEAILTDANRFLSGVLDERRGAFRKLVQKNPQLKRTHALGQRNATAVPPEEFS